MVTPQHFFRTVGANDSGEHHSYSISLSKTLELCVAGYSHTGMKREHNEDNYLLQDGLLVVCDGMGAHASGEVASEIACTVFGENHSEPDSNLEKGLITLAEEAHSAILQEVNRDPSKNGMGTTLVAARFGDGKINFINVGDSRLYRYSLDDDTLEQLTVDHSFVQEKFDRGEITREQMKTHKHKNILTLCLGSQENLDTAKIREDTVTCSSGDVYLLCSDGLNVLDDAVIKKVMNETYAAHPDNDLAVPQALVAAANTAGGPDNISVVVARVRQYSQEEIIRTKVVEGVKTVMDKLHKQGKIYTRDEAAQMVEDARREEVTAIIHKPTRILAGLQDNAKGIGDLLVTSYSAAADQELIRKDAAELAAFVSGLGQVYEKLIRSYATAVTKALEQRDLVSVREFLHQLDSLTPAPTVIGSAPEDTLPSVPHLYYRAADLHFVLGDYQQVLPLLEKLEQMNGIQEERLLGPLYLLRAKTALAQGRITDTLDALEKSSAAGKRQHFYNRKGIDELPALYDAIISKHYQAVMNEANDAVAYTETVRALLAKTAEKPEGTELDYVKYTLHQGQRAGATNALVDLGLSYYLDEKHASAEIVLAKLVEDNTKIPFVYNTLAEVVRQQNRTSDPEREQWTKWLDWKANELEQKA